MLFVFLVDENEDMRNLVMTSRMSEENSPFSVTCLDTALYFVEYFSKNVFGGSGRVVDESVSQRHKGNDHHRTVFFTFNSTNGGQLNLKSTWKDHQSGLFEAVKNVSFDARRGKKVNKTAAASTEDSIQAVADKFEEFMEKFSSSYFACTSRNNGYFIWNEPESILVFTLSSCRARLNALNTRFSNAWQRKNVFIHVNPDSLLPSDFVFSLFPVPTLRDAHQLGQALFRATTVETFEFGGMELLGKGAWIEFANENSAGLALLKSRFAGHSRWPIPIPLNELSFSSELPKLLVQSGGRNPLPALEFDEYVTFCPLLFASLSATEGGRLYLFVESQVAGPCLIGFVEAFEEAESTKSLVRVFIGPMAFDRLLDVFTGKLDLAAYLRSVPQFYEHFLRAALGEVKWAGLCGGTGKSFQKSDFVLPRGFVDRKTSFRSSSRQKFKAELSVAVERTEAVNRMGTMKRSNEFSTRLIPPLERLQGDASSLSRLLNRFKLAQGVFDASCQPEESEATIGATLFKHCLPTSQMTDYTEVMRRKRPLRPLFTEQERDLFLLLKNNPYLQEEMNATEFVSGDIFGNPFKRDRRDRAAKQKNSVTSSVIEEVVDEIDVRELEDMETDIVIDGQVVNLPTIPETTVDEELSTVDLYIVSDLIRSPGGSKARAELDRSLSAIYDTSTLEDLLLLSQRYKRKQLEPLIQKRLDSIVK